MNPIVRLVASASPGEKKYVLFAGAGVSKDAGIPTSWDLMLKTASLLYLAENMGGDIKTKLNISQLEDWFLHSEYAKMEYSELMNLLYPNYPDQQNFLKEYLNDHKVGDSHHGIAELARRGIIRAIITTNFDHYIEKAMEEKGIDIQVISNDDDLEKSEPLIHCKPIRIYKPHGDLGRGGLKNTPRDLEKLSPLMENELVRVLSEHGVMVLGYSGRDKSIQNVLAKRNPIYYPLFWIDPCAPSGDVEAILKSIGYTYIQCKGAGQFISDYILIIDRLENLAPTAGISPTISDLRNALSSPGEPVEALFGEFLKNIYVSSQEIQPDFTKFPERDEAVVQQIDVGLKNLNIFLEAAIEAAKYKNIDALKKIYEFFGDGLMLYDIPDNFSGSYYLTDFDGNKFLLQEMFVSFVAILIKYNLWDVIRNLLNKGLLINKSRDGGYVSFRKINSFIHSLDIDRNNRLNLRRTSITADILKDRFSGTMISQLITFEEFIDADYFILIYTICHESDLSNPRDIWIPFSSIYLEKPPGYIRRAESKEFLEILSKTCGCTDLAEFIEKIRISSALIHKIWPHGFYHGPLAYYDFTKLGTWP